MKKIILTLFFLVSMFAFSKEFWEKNNFTVNVVEDLKINNSTKTKKYIMNYGNGQMKLTITSPSINKGEVYTFKGNTKTIYYPSLKQTVTQKLQTNEANILNVFNKLKTIKEKNTQTKNGDTFTFKNKVLSSIKSSGYTVIFSNYVKSGEYTYPTIISVKDQNSQITYKLSNFK